MVIVNVAINFVHILRNIDQSPNSWTARISFFFTEYTTGRKYEQVLQIADLWTVSAIEFISGNCSVCWIKSSMHTTNTGYYIQQVHIECIFICFEKDIFFDHISWTHTSKMTLTRRS